MMTASDLSAIALAWARIPGLRPRRFWRAVEAAGSMDALRQADPVSIAAAVGSLEIARQIVNSDVRAAREQLAAIERQGTTVLHPFSGTYPRLLREIPDPPLVLYARGRLEHLNLPAVAIVGARAATNYGREVASDLARDLSAAGLCVVSGMARGIDGAAHRAAAAGPGGTAAVLGCGPDIVYPPEHEELWKRIEETGAIVTEFPPGEPPRERNFPTRNRIIAGMASAVVVVEAAQRSGSLITARFAADFGRDVFAVPGSIRSEASEGCHALLRDGAILCRGVEDVLSEIFPAIGRPNRTPASVELLSEDASRVLGALRREEASAADDLAEATLLPPAVLLAILFDLEAQGHVKTLPGNLYAAVRDRADS